MPGPDKKSEVNYAKESRNDFWCELECLEKHSFYDDLKLAYWFNCINNQTPMGGPAAWKWIQPSYHVNITQHLNDNINSVDKQEEEGEEKIEYFHTGRREKKYSNFI